MAILLPLKSILPWCCITFSFLLSSSGSISHSTASSSITLTKSSKPTNVPSNSRFDCSTINTFWLIVLSMTSKGKISGRLILRASVYACECTCIRYACCETIYPPRKPFSLSLYFFYFNKKASILFYYPDAKKNPSIRVKKSRVRLKVPKKTKKGYIISLLRLPLVKK
ncbi:hypothetical protein AWRI1631_52140 [Saccharomyces cerevisiae AWRI1631]|uniref:Secreted protein n=1 Tax=Saccharomyces cerevisiae (strain AWRI1631) TaxID=545124 RepID=B5VHS3_YEAS6|nr:hypothetical protein AWRI1631_52140 [Saccharomyces cerevisiae AWRI1631]